MSLDYQLYTQGELLNDRYLKVQNISEGSFGVVSLAKDIKFDRLVALKYNTPSLSDFNYNNKHGENKKNKDFEEDSLSESNDRKYDSHGEREDSDNDDRAVSKSLILKETQQEINMLKRVSKHPNITELYDSFDTYIVMEYASRGDLHDAIQMGIAPVSTKDVVDVFMQLMSAVEYCHSLGVYHRDIKPENILISDDWSIKLTDFGLATDEVYCTDFDVGSERYMAPELLEHKGIDTYSADKVDIWSMGICLLNIVFGKNPFSSASSKDKLFLHFAANRETLFDIFPSLNYDLFAVLRYSLTIDPSNRDLELMKDNLLKVEHLTCDYEFEEEEAVEVIEEKPVEETSEKIIEGKQEQITTKDEGSNKENNEESSNVVITKIPSIKPRHRGQRKPLKIPNLQNNHHRSQNGRVNRRHYNIQFNNNYNNNNHSGSYRELDEPFKRSDFFTPKSVFNHYMDKVQKNRVQQQPIHEHSSSYNNNRSNYYGGGHHKGRAWKKRKPRYSTGHYGGNGNANGTYKDTHKDNYKSRNSFKKGSYRSKESNNNHPASFVKHRNNSLKGATSVAHSLGHSLGTGHGHDYHSFNGSTKLRGSIGTSGKYIPPNLRHSPKYDIYENAIESEDDYTHNGTHDEDDMFLIEDVNQGHHLADKVESTKEDSKRSEKALLKFEESKKEEPAYSSLLEPSTGPSTISSLTDQLANSSLGSNAFAASRLPLLSSIDMTPSTNAMATVIANSGNSRDTSVTTTFSNNVSSIRSNITSGTTTYDKYVPPHHRRNSHSAVMQSSGSGILKKAVPTLASIDNTDLQNYPIPPSKQVRIITPSVSSSVPTTKTNWFNNRSHLQQQVTSTNRETTPINWFDLDNDGDMDFVFDDDDDNDNGDKVITNNGGKGEIEYSSSDRYGSFQSIRNTLKRSEEKVHIYDIAQSSYVS